MNDLTGNYLSKYADRTFRLEDWGDSSIHEVWTGDDGTERRYNVKRSVAETNIREGWWVLLPPSDPEEPTNAEVLGEIAKTLDQMAEVMRQLAGAIRTSGLIERVGATPQKGGQFSDG